MFIGLLRGGCGLMPVWCFALLSSLCIPFDRLSASEFRWCCVPSSRMCRGQVLCHGDGLSSSDVIVAPFGLIAGHLLSDLVPLLVVADLGIVPVVRKLCFVLQNHLGKGDAALSRCIPLAVPKVNIRNVWLEKTILIEAVQIFFRRI